MVSSLSSEKTYIFSEGDNVAFIEKANEFFGNDQIEVIKGIESVSGDTQLRTLYDFFSRIDHPAHVFFVWDCDVKYQLEPRNKTFPYIFLTNDSNKRVTRGIENLFAEEAFTSEFYDVKPKPDGGTHSSLNKRQFTDHMIANGTESDFQNFNPLFEHIKQTVANPSPEPAAVA